MPYNPQIQDQRGEITMQGLALGQRQGAFLTNLLLNYLGQKSEDNAMRYTAKGMIQDPAPLPSAPGFLQGLPGTEDEYGGAPQGAPASGNADDAATDPAIQEWTRKADQAKAMRKVVQVYHPEAKDLNKALDAMGHSELEGLFRTWGMKSAMEDSAAKNGEHAARMRDLDAQAKLRKEEAASDEAAGVFLNHYLNAPPIQEQGPTGSPEEQDLGGSQGITMRQPTTQERWAYAAGHTPGFGGRAGTKMLASLARYNETAQENGPPKVYPGPYAGISFAQSASGRGGLHIVTDPSQMAGSVIDPSTGKVIPNMINTRNGPKAIPQPKKEDAALVQQRIQQANKLFLANAQQAAGELNYTQKSLGKLKPNDPGYAAAQRAVSAAQALYDSIMKTNPHAGNGSEKPDKERSPEETQNLIEQANDAIAQGADPAKVHARLKEKYGIEVN